MRLGSQALTDAGLVEVWSPGPVPGSVWAAPVDGGPMVAVDAAGRVLLTQAEAVRRSAIAGAARSGELWAFVALGRLELHGLVDCCPHLVPLRDLVETVPLWDVADAVRSARGRLATRDRLLVCLCADAAVPSGVPR